MTKKTERSFRDDFRIFFLRGLATLLPTILTIVLLFKGYEFIQQNISVHITEGVIRVVVLLSDKYPQVTDEDIKEYCKENKKQIEKITPEMKVVRLWKLRTEWNHGARSLLGFFLAILLFYISGRILASIFGRRMWRMFEKGVSRVPGFKQIYPYIKQVTDFLFSDEKKIEFNRVVAVQYPRKGLWSLGLVTGAGMKSLSQQDKTDYLTIFIPSSPTPVTGYVIHAQKDEVVDLPLTIEEALRFTISGGVIVPDHQLLPTQMEELHSILAADKEDIPQNKETIQ